MEKEHLMSILIAKDNDFFRGCLDKNDSAYIYDAQINTARKIVMQLASNVLRTNHVMLLAPMQSGKTATCISVVNIINKSKLYKNMSVNKYFFISGMNDCGLKTQTYERVKSQVIGANDDNICINSKNNNSKYFVFKNSDLLSYDGILDNSLIFIDESHYGSNEKNVLTQFLVKHGIDWKNTKDLISRNIYIVSVSATPFDELISDRIQSKKMVELDTDDEYVGVSTYLEKDVIFDAEKDDIEEGGAIFDYIMDAHWRMEEKNELGVIIIRTRNFNVIKNDPYVIKNFETFEMYSSGTTIQYNELNDKMELLYKNNNESKKNKRIKPLIVLIKGAFRAGITINQKYKDIIYMVYDYSVKADTTAQALLGRMCGYRAHDSHIENTYFYLNKKFANMYSAWENDFQNKDLIPCNKTSWEWVDNGYTGDDVQFGSRPCGNFAINLNDDEVKEIFLLGKGKRNRASLIENRFNELLEKNGYNIKYDYINEVQISGKNNYAKSSQEKRFNSFSEDSLVFQFRPEKIKKFVDDTKRNYLTREDVGKRCVSIVLDAEITDNLNISGNKRLLVYYVEVGQKQMVFSRKGQYKQHKDTDVYSD